MAVLKIFELISILFEYYIFIRKNPKGIYIYNSFEYHLNKVLFKI